METEYTVERLTGKNYLLWSMQLQLVLELKDLWKYVDGTFTEAEGELEKEKQHTEISQCLAEIVLNIDARHHAAVLGKKNPREVWNILKDMHTSNRRNSQLALRMRLHRVQMKANQSVSSFVEEICDLVNELYLSGYEVSEVDKKVSLLSGLRDDYAMIRTVLQVENDLSFEEMISHLEATEVDLAQGKASRQARKARF